MIELSEIQKLEPDSIIEVFLVDATNINAGIFRFHAGTNELRQNIFWQGEEYVRYPIQAAGFQMTGSGPAPRPHLVVSNFMSAITTVLLGSDDLLGAKVVRKRTLKKYLDAVNFTDGINANADSSAHFADDIYYVDRKVNESKEAVEFELVSALDLSGVMVPKRQIIQNSCPWKYRGAECGYTGTSYFTKNDLSTADQTKDSCSKKLQGCKARFGVGAELPYGGFPGADLYKGG